MTEINAYLVQRGFNPLPKCGVCKSKPFRWRKGGYEFKLYATNKWQLLLGGALVRYGQIETAIAEMQEYMGEGQD